MKHFIFEIGETFLGVIFMAFSISCFLLPNQLSSGGFSGIATIFYYLANIPMGITIVMLNIPIFILAIFKLGKKFVIKAVIGTTSLSILIDFFDKFPPITNDRFLACVYGGVIVGIGTAIVFKAHSSTGGTELITNIIQSYNSHMQISTALIIIDIIIVALNVIFFGEIEIGLYSSIVIYLTGKMIDIIFEGINFSKLVFIVSSKNDLISSEIEKQVKRGITGLNGKGMYTNNPKLILMCACSRNDISHIKDISKRIDKNCFIIITNAREVFGEGFKTDLTYIPK